MPSNPRCGIVHENIINKTTSIMTEGRIAVSREMKKERVAPGLDALISPVISKHLNCSCQI